MAEGFAAGDRVLVRLQDHPGHTRAPRYVRGRVGTVLAAAGEHPLPDDVVARVSAPRRQTVLTVVFPAAELFGSGEHSVSVDLWEAYLTPAGERGR